MPWLRVGPCVRCVPGVKCTDTVCRSESPWAGAQLAWSSWRWAAAMWPGWGCQQGTMCVFGEGCGGAQSCCDVRKAGVQEPARWMKEKRRVLVFFGVEGPQGLVASAWPSLWKSQLQGFHLETSPFQLFWLPKPEWENLKTIASLWVYSFLWNCCQNSSLCVFLTGMLWTWLKSSHPRSSSPKQEGCQVFSHPFFFASAFRTGGNMQHFISHNRGISNALLSWFYVTMKHFCTFLISEHCRNPWLLRPCQQTPFGFGCQWGSVCNAVPHTAWADQPEVFDPLCWDLCCDWGNECS